MKENKYIRLFEDFKNYLNFLGYSKTEDFGEPEKKFYYDGPKHEAYCEIWTNDEINHSIQLIKKKYPTPRSISDYIFINGNESTFLKTIYEVNTFIKDENKFYINYPEFIPIHSILDISDEKNKSVKSTVVDIQPFLEFINKNIIKLLTEEYLIKIIDVKNISYENIGIIKLFEMLDPNLKAINNIFRNVLNSELSEYDKSRLLNMARIHNLSILKDLDIDYINVADDEAELF